MIRCTVSEDTGRLDLMTISMMRTTPPISSATRVRACLLSLLMLAVAAEASAIPTGYSFTMDDGVGSFTVDPDLAAPLGDALVAVTAFEVTLTSVEFGSNTIMLADITSGQILSAAFRDGALAGLDINVANGLIPGTDLGFEMTFDTANPVLDLSNPGEANIIVIDTNTFEFSNHCCSYSITQDPGETDPVIPEPTAALLFGAGLLAVQVGSRGRLGRTR